jgi:hypothetical protein
MTISKYHKTLKIYLEISREFLSGDWQYWSNLPALPTDSYYFFSFPKVGIPRDMSNYFRGSSTEIILGNAGMKGSVSV